MQVILLERVEKLGFMGDLVEVKAGFARNYLLPQKKALRASANNLEYFKNQKAQLEATNLKRRAEAEKAAERMTDVSVTIVRQASESGHLYGSVRSQDIAVALIESGVQIGRTQVALDTPIKALGIHKARIILHPEVSVSIDVRVAQSAEEALFLLTDEEQEAANAAAQAAAPEVMVKKTKEKRTRAPRPTEAEAEASSTEEEA